MLKNHFFMLLSLLAVLMGQPVFADLRVVVTGDSHTYRYADQSFGFGTLAQRAYEQRRSDALILPVYTGGVSTETYIQQGRVAEVLAQDPDVIQLLLGTNDAAQRWGLPTYSRNMTAILDAFASYTNGRGHHPVVVVSTAMPIIAPFAPNLSEVTTHIEQNNRWLRDEVIRREDFILIDFYDTLTREADWEHYYLDGVHMDGVMTPYLSFGEFPAGYILLTEQFRDAALLAIPEPGSSVMIVLLCVFIRQQCYGRLVCRP